jgi:hypothetical protein
MEKFQGYASYVDWNYELFLNFFLCFHVNKMMINWNKVRFSEFQGDHQCPYERNYKSTLINIVRGSIVPYLSTCNKTKEGYEHPHP